MNEAKKNVILTRYTFESELLKIPAQCKKLTNKTSKEKIKAIFKKYDFLIGFSKESIQREEKRSTELKYICNALKSGIVHYEGGFFKICEILRVKMISEKIIVFFKNGTELSCSKDFEWLLNLY